MSPSDHRLALAFVLVAAGLALSCDKGSSNEAPAGSASGAPRPSTTPTASATSASSATAAATTSAATPPSSGEKTAEAGGACGMDGTWRAVEYACKGEKKHVFPPFLVWTVAINGADAPFKEQFSAPAPTCTGVQPWKASCTKNPDVLTLSANAPEQCTPSDCLHAPRGKPSGGCGNVPGAPLIWSITEHTPTSLVLTSMEPFALTTCTSMGKKNPLTVWWQKQ